MNGIARPDRVLTASEWAKVWGVHRNTARAWLRRLYDKYGDGVVQRYGRQGSYRASAEDLRRVASAPSDELVTQEQLARAMGEVWRAIERVGRSDAPRKCTPTAQDCTGPSPLSRFERRDQEQAAEEMPDGPAAPRTPARPQA